MDVSFNCWEAEVNSGFKSDIADIFIPTCLCLCKNNTQNISTGGSWLFIKSTVNPLINAPDVSIVSENSITDFCIAKLEN